jgi:predicted lactoylglutathione lyase
MIRSLYVNLPVADLARTKAFFAALGLGFNERFTNEQAACLVVNEHVSCMLLQRPFFQGFTKLPVADATAATEVLLALQVDSRAEVDELVA